MNMNDKDWAERWDDEPSEDDEYNDLGSDIDANNDETFDNAAEWNEDEHELLIARDSILSHTIRGGNHAPNERSNNRTNTSPGFSDQNLGRNERGTLNNNNEVETRNAALMFAGIMNPAAQKGWNSVNSNELFPSLEQRRLDQPSSSGSQAWQNMRAPKGLKKQKPELDRISQIQDNQNKNLPGHRPQGDLFNPPPPMPQILRVDELERQLMSTSIGPKNPIPDHIEPPRRAGWSPFGGKDLFTTPDSPNQTQIPSLGQNTMMSTSHLPPHLTPEQQQQILIHHHQQLLQQQQKHHQQQIQQLQRQQQELQRRQQAEQVQQQLAQFAILKQKQIEQEQQRLAPRRCFTVEELERQMVAGRNNDIREKTPVKPKEEEKISQDRIEHREPRDSRAGRDLRDSRTGRDARDGREPRERRDAREFRNDRERRDVRNSRDVRDGRFGGREDGHSHRKPDTIIPPQVQLKVIEKARRLHSVTTMHADEFLRDHLPRSGRGFDFRRHSTARDKSLHDGVLTENERQWLTRIQEKIQADYDEKLDEDYYYMLYFNRSSMTDEAAQKPCGPGVFDRRFIPRERLLY